MIDQAISFTPATAAAPLPRPSSPQAHRILVAEDDEDIRRLNTEALLQSGYQVDGAEHGAAAWESLQLKRYHLLITDNDMPMLTGVGLLKKLRAARMDLPVIMATGTVPADEFTRNPALLPAAVLIKPYTIDELLGAVREVLRVTEVAPDETPPETWQNQQPTDGWQL